MPALQPPILPDAEGALGGDQPCVQHNEALLTDNDLAEGSSSLTAIAIQPLLPSIGPPVASHPAAVPVSVTIPTALKHLPVEILSEIAQYVSHDDLRKFRLSSKALAEGLAAVMFRNVETKFGRAMYNLGSHNPNMLMGSIFEKFGADISNFKVSFEIDLEALRTAPGKILSYVEKCWWGEYEWPLPEYQQHTKLKKLEFLASDLILLANAMSKLTNASALALSIDTGHGWLNGPDLPNIDITIWEMSRLMGTPVLQPGRLTERQVEWLLETGWAQRAFLRSYRTSVWLNRAIFTGVHTLNIAKISSGLLPTLADKGFWGALPGLKTLTILVIPDWRLAHRPGDTSFLLNMATRPDNASTYFAKFLEQYITPIEHLDTLSIGFVGGGEHAAGICSRNQHILPAPITTNAACWVNYDGYRQDLKTLLCFEHVVNLTIENAWVSPAMLKGFMTASKNTSLHHLRLNSISMTGVHSQRDSPLTMYNDASMDPKYRASAWLKEQLPGSHCWPAVIDSITPGYTFLERKYNAGLIDTVNFPRSNRRFRGNIRKISFKSCGYATISGFSSDVFNQNGVMNTIHHAISEAFFDRREFLKKNTVIRNPTPDLVTGQISKKSIDEREEALSGGVMMWSTDAEGKDWPFLGTIAQCIPAVEKRVLEGAWGMVLGWGSDVGRLAAVEDGFLEGGTGRFSGVVSK